MHPGLLLVSLFTFVELNCENLFDCQHDSLKRDHDFLPASAYHWTPNRYWRKLNRIGQTIVACGGEGDSWALPDMVALCEVENDSVLRDLTRRSLLRTARYEYVITDSPDERGIDVALLYSPFSFALLRHYAIRVPALDGMRPTRDILYAAGRVITGDTLHVFVVHAPSRSGGERATRRNRVHVARRVASAIDSIRVRSPRANIIVAGDFNDHTDDESLRTLYAHGLSDVTAQATGQHGARGTYRYHGAWESLDHVLMGGPMAAWVSEAFINDAPFLLTDDEKYGGKQPWRTYLGPRYLNGFSDHLPLVVRLTWPEP